MYCNKARSIWIYHRDGSVESFQVGHKYQMLNNSEIIEIKYDPSIMDSLGIARGGWLYLDALDNLNSHYIAGGWEKITEKFPEQIKYLEERLEQYWNQKVITEWENGIKEYLIECDYWKE